MIALLLLFQAQVPAAPAIPVGTRSEFHKAVDAVETKLAAKDFAGASQALRLLPQRRITLKWDESKVPAARRGEFEESRDAAILRWTKDIPGLAITLTKDRPDIKIDFEEVLAKLDGESSPQPSVTFFSDSAEDPRMEAVIGLKRGDPLVPVTGNEVFDEVGYAIGSYLGLAPSPLVGFFMGRTNASGQPAYNVGYAEVRSAKKVLDLTDELAKAAKNKTALRPTHPSLFLDPKSIALPVSTQGDKVAFSFQATNRGDGSLQLETIPDCGCITAAGPQSLEAGRSVLVGAKIDTQELSGDFHRRLLVASNDPRSPWTEIPVTLHVNALYEWIGPDHAATLSDDSGAFDLYLSLNPKADFKPTQARITGIPGAVNILPFKGEAPAASGDPVKIAKGYKFHVTMDRSMLTGRAWAGLEVLTNDSSLGTLRYTLTVQNGIVAAPNSLFMGDLHNATKQFNIQIVRPHKPFKILKVEFDSAHLSLFSKTGDGDLYTLTIGYDGKAEIGEFRGIFRVFTDDPKQPVIEVPYSASVM